MYSERASAFLIASLLTTEVLSQTEPPPQPGAAATPGQPESQRTDPTTTTPGTISRSPTHATQTLPHEPTTASGVSAGAVVQTSAGESIGSVQDIVPDSRSGQPAYVLLATSSGHIAVPYWAITRLLRDGHIVIERPQLNAAPRVRDKQLHDPSDVMWKKQADQYWSKYR